MKKELREKIINYNRAVKENGEKANDLDVIVTEIAKLPQGQIKKVLTKPVLEVLKKYGIEIWK